MPKAFLSHSSKQKNYVEKVAIKLGQERIIYDSFTFEEGNKTIDEILFGIESSDVFVLFISNDALNSTWVKKEIILGKKALELKKIKGFFPIIVDDTDNDDSRIPEWIKEYNLRNVKKTTKAAERIIQKLRIVSWDLVPKNKERQQLFIGRNEIKRKFEERILSFDSPTPISIIVSGLPQVGRRSFLLHALTTSHRIRDYYKPLVVSLSSKASIEDFILYIYDLGYIDTIDRENLVDFLIIPLNEKIELAAILLEEIFKTNNIIFILDNFCIVGQDGSISDWYLTLLDILKSRVQKSSLMIISRVVPYYRLLLGKEYIFSIHVPGLEKTECNSLFQALLDLEGIELLLNKKKTISEQFTGFPTQIIYTVDYIKNIGIENLLRNLYIIPDYNSEQVSSSVQKYENNERAMDLLKILAEYDILSLRLLEKIYGEITQDIQELIVDFTNHALIEFIGAAKEYMKLNDGIRDYINRLNIRISDKYYKAIKEYSLKVLREYNNNLESDISELSVSIQTALVNNNQDEIPRELLIPSYYLNAMNELYRKRSYEAVEELARKLLQNSNNLDKKVIREIRYWLCSSLAKRRNPKFIEEIQFLDGPDHNFLFGFYYRLIRKYESAQNRLKNLLDEHPNHQRAKRELVIVYSHMEDYESAFELARDCYLSNKNNPYYIHGYFRCLIQKENGDIKYQKDLEILLSQMKSIPSEKAEEMYFSLNAEFFAIILKNKEKAYSTIDEAIRKFSENVYPYLSKMEISRKFHDKEVLNSVLASINNKFSQTELEYRLNYLSSTIISHCLNGNFDEADRMLKTKIKDKYDQKVIKSLVEEINSIKRSK